MGDIIEHEKKLESYLQGDNKGAAVELLVELIVQSARDKEFDRAEDLRDKLLDIDPMAVNEIVKTGEVIESEKSDAIDKDHLDIWADLYDRLTPEETNALYYGMKPVTHLSNHLVYKQGEIRSCLYFIDHGQLKMFYQQADKSRLLKTLRPGDIFGEDTFFFSEAFCSTSVMTDSPVKLYVLFKDDLDKLAAKTPGLESKLNEYCLSLETVADLLKAKQLERRIEKRLNIPGKVFVQQAEDSDRAAVEPFRAELLDISASGLAFLMKTTDKVSSRLLGRDLSLELSFDELGSDTEIKRVGTVVAVNIEPFHEYIVHADFLENLDPGSIDDLAALLDTAEE